MLLKVNFQPKSKWPPLNFWRNCLLIHSKLFPLQMRPSKLLKRRISLIFKPTSKGQYQRGLLQCRRSAASLEFFRQKFSQKIWRISSFTHITWKEAGATWSCFVLCWPTYWIRELYFRPLLWPRLLIEDLELEEGLNLEFIQEVRKVHVFILFVTHSVEKSGFYVKSILVKLKPQKPTILTSLATANVEYFGNKNHFQVWNSQIWKFKASKTWLNSSFWLSENSENWFHVKSEQQENCQVFTLCDCRLQWCEIPRFTHCGNFTLSLRFYVKSILGFLHF